MPGKMARSDPRPSVGATRGAGSGQHLASVLQEGRENANIDAGLGFIWRISGKGNQSMASKGVVRDLIYDVGMNNGDDTAYYLHQGFRVIAIDADPRSLEAAKHRFPNEL